MRSGAIASGGASTSPLAREASEADFINHVSPPQGAPGAVADPLGRVQGGGAGTSPLAREASEAEGWSAVDLQGQAPYTPIQARPTPCTLHPTPYTPHPSPYTLHPTPDTLHYTLYTIHYTLYTLHLTPHTPFRPRRCTRGASSRARRCR